MDMRPEEIAVIVAGIVGSGGLVYFLSRRQTTDETIRESVRTSYLDADRALMKVVNAAANMREAELRAKTAALQSQSAEEVSKARGALATSAKAAKEAVVEAKGVVAAEGTGPGSRVLATKVEGLEQQLQEIQKSLTGLANANRDARAERRSATGGKKKRKNEKKTKRAKKHHGV
jgi:hypothetical protein